MSDTTPIDVSSSDATSTTEEVLTMDAPTETPDVPVQAAPRPRIRWGAIVWGLIVCGIAAVTLQVTRTAESREGFALWLSKLTPGGVWLIVVLITGSILLLLGILAAIRRAQRAR